MATRTLILIRHAKSSWKDSSLSDRERPLNKRGKRGAPVVGQRLRALEIAPDLILSSPANRAFSTCKIIAEAVQYPLDQIQQKEKLYEFSYEGAGVRSIIREIESQYKTVAIFGHNPTFSGLSNDFSEGSIDDMPTCAVACFDIEADSWSDFESAPKQLRFYLYPKMLSTDL